MTTLALPVSAVTRLADLDPLHLATAGFLARYTTGTRSIESADTSQG